MLLLVTDTSGKNGFVALVRAGEAAQSQLDVIEEVPLAGGTFSAQLVPQIAGLLSKHGLKKSDIGALIAISGPGSFTGLRVGLAAIKALAEVLQKPIVPVSLLEAVAFASGRKGRVLAASDAGRGDVYLGEYEIAGQSTQMIEERLLARGEFFSSAQQRTAATPDSNLAAAAVAAGAPILQLKPVSAEPVACVGWQKLRSNSVVSPEQLEANYIRRTDAEIFAKPASHS